jgi:hypothetical protein
VVAGHSITFNLTVTPNNGFINSITFSCSGQPAGVGCSFNPQTVTPGGNGGALSTALTVTTTTGVASLNAPSLRRGQGQVASDNGFLLPGAFGLIGLLLTERGSSKKRRRGKSALLAMGLLSLTFAGLTGCGGNPPATVVHLNVVATGGGTSYSTNIPLIVTR